MKRDTETAGPHFETEGLDDLGTVEAVHFAQATARDTRKLLNIVAAAVTVAALYFAREVLLPITLAVILSFVLTPIVSQLQRLRLPRAMAAVLAVLAALALVGLIGTLIGSQAAALSSDAPKYAQTVENKVQNLQGYAVLKLAALTQVFGQGAKPASGARAGDAGAPALTGQPSKRDAEGVRRPVPVEVEPAPLTPTEIMRKVLSPVVGPLETAFIVLIVAIFILIQREDLRDRVIRLFGSADLHRTTIALDDAGQRLSRYFLSQLLVNSGFGVMIGLGLWIIGIPSPGMWGILAGLLRFVPYIGSFLSVLAPLALAAAISPDWGMTLFVALLYLGIETLVGYVIEPMVYGHSTGLSPISVIIAAIFWTWVWGPVGLIISTPLTLCFVVLGRHVKAFEFFDVLLGDRPALTPIETFYQRILANNADEALAQAELMLGDLPFVDYCDNVIVPSLRLAAQDEARGTIDRARGVKFKRLMMSVIEDLWLAQGESGDRTAGNAAAAPAGKIVCVFGRGPFDRALARLFEMLLANAGASTLVLSYEQVARDASALLDQQDITAIALIGLNPEGATAAIRQLVRRIRVHYPKCRIMVGVWSQNPAEPAAPAEAQTVGADDYATSLKEATAKCLAPPFDVKAVAA